jgi:transcriptional regulator CtsR
MGALEVKSLASRYQRRRFKKSAREQVIDDLRQDAALTQQEIELVRQARADQLVQVAAANSNEVRHRVRE